MLEPTQTRCTGGPEVGPMVAGDAGSAKWYVEPGILSDRFGWIFWWLIVKVVLLWFLNVLWWVNVKHGCLMMVNDGIRWVINGDDDSIMIVTIDVWWLITDYWSWIMGQFDVNDRWWFFLLFWCGMMINTISWWCQWCNDDQQYILMPMMLDDGK